MKCSFLLLFSVLAFGANPDLVKVKSVYVMPMTNGMDQYLANHLQSSSIYVVVTDPQSADAVFTDSLGPAFEKKMADLYPPEKEDDDEEKGDTGNGRPLTNRKGRGMVFLVERGTRHVVWSRFDPPKNTSAAQMNATAKRITEHLQKDLGMKVAK